MEGSIKKFLRKVRADTKRCNVFLNLVDEYLVYYPYDDCEYAGYFSIEPNLELCVAVKKPQKKWLPILVHEYCHFLQWSENSDVWNNNLVYDGYDGETMIERWVTGKIALGKSKLENCLKTTIEVELDAEKRSVEMIKKFNLPIDIKIFIQKANASLMFYPIFLEKKKWFDKPPFEMEEVFSQLPTEFLDDYTNIDEKYIKIYNDYCFVE